MSAQEAMVKMSIEQQMLVGDILTVGGAIFFVVIFYISVKKILEV